MDENFCILSLNLGIEWKKVYGLDYSEKELFKDLKEAENKNAENETANLFSILDQLEKYRDCNGDLHLKLCYPELAGNFTDPCNEWIQSSNPATDSIIKGYKPIKITFRSTNKDFPGLGLTQRGKATSLIEDFPYIKNGRSFSIGTIKETNGKVQGPNEYMVEQVELFVNPGKISHKFVIYSLFMYPLISQISGSQ